MPPGRWSPRRGDRRTRTRRRRRPAAARAAVRGVIVIQLFANGAGALAVYVFLKLLFPTEVVVQRTTEGAVNLTVFSVYLAVTFVLAVPINAVILRKAVAWVREGREPNGEEIRETLTQPLRQTVSAFLGWLGGAVIFGLVTQSSDRVAAGILLAGLVTSTLLYLLLERHFRPIFELALADAELPEDRRDILPRIMLAWLLGSAIPLLTLGLAPLTTAKEDLEFSWRLSVLVASAIVAGGLVLRAAAWAVAEPVNRVRKAMARVEEGDLDVHVPVDDIGELGRLSAGFNSMVSGLRERARLFELLDQQVGTEVARHALVDPPQLGGGRREVTVLFVDLMGYTAYAEHHTPEEVVEMLNGFFAVVVDTVVAEHGHVNKFEGDAALCVFGAPDDQADHAARALAAAAALPPRLAALRQELRAGIGVATGQAVAGYVGTPHRYEYTVIGDVVNIAARLTDLAKDHDEGVLATEETVAAAGEAAAVWRPQGRVNVRGRTGETTVYTPADSRERAAAASLA